MHARLTTALVAALTAAWLAAPSAWAESYRPFIDSPTLRDEPAAPLAEEAVAFPDQPADDDLIAIDTGPTARHRNAVALSSITFGGDHILRYALVVDTAGGARNVSYEAIDCPRRAWKLYATAQGGQWVAARQPAWRAIENTGIGNVRAVLARDFFCAGDVLVRDAESARTSLRRGGRKGARHD